MSSGSTTPRASTDLSTSMTAEAGTAYVGPTLKTSTFKCSHKISTEAPDDRRYVPADNFRDDYLHKAGDAVSSTAYAHWTVSEDSPSDVADTSLSSTGSTASGKERPQSPDDWCHLNRMSTLLSAESRQAKRASICDTAYEFVTLDALPPESLEKISPADQALARWHSDQKTGRDSRSLYEPSVNTCCLATMQAALSLYEQSEIADIDRERLRAEISRQVFEHFILFTGESVQDERELIRIEDPDAAADLAVQNDPAVAKEGFCSMWRTEANGLGIDLSVPGFGVIEANENGDTVNITGTTRMPMTLSTITRDRLEKPDLRVPNPDAQTTDLNLAPQYVDAMLSSKPISDIVGPDKELYLLSELAKEFNEGGRRSNRGGSRRDRSGPTLTNVLFRGMKILAKTSESE